MKKNYELFFQISNSTLMSILNKALPNLILEHFVIKLITKISIKLFSTDLDVFFVILKNVMIFNKATSSNEEKL